MEDKREIRGWVLYDWANSAYVLTVATAVLPAYFAASVVPPEGVRIFGSQVAASALWGVAVSLAAILVFAAAPVLGAVADRSGAKRRFLMLFCLGGSVAAVALAGNGPGDVWQTLGLFVAAQVCFACANVFYDAFLPQITTPERMDMVSGQGFAAGYIGGGLQFLLALGVVAGHERLGLSQPTAARLAMAMAGVWWLGFAQYSFARLRDRPPSDGAAPLSLGASVRQGLRMAKASARELVRGGPVSSFLLAFLFYNDGIETVITMATIYAQEELKLPVTSLMLTLLAIQAVAFGGSLAFSRLAGRMGTKGALLTSLVLWTGVVVYAYFIDSATEYFILGALVGLVLGGSQALSRSLFARLIPREQSAQYFGYFSVLNRLSAIGGPLVFAVVRQFSGSARDAVLVIVVFFLVGIVLLSRLRLPAAAARQA